MQVSIIIVSWRVRDQLWHCLESIEKYCASLQTEVIVIDNNSQDGTVEMITEEFPKITLIANDHNAGFAAAVNQGIKQSSGEAILLLNPDTEVLPGSVERMLAILHNNPDIGILGSQLVNPDGSVQPSVRAFPDVASHVLVLLKLINVFPKLKPLRHYLQKDFNYTEEHDVDQVMGAAFLFPRAVLKKIGLLDERFYIWYEEVDYCKRARAAGYRVVYSPAAKIMHQRGASFRQILPIRRQMILNKSMLHYFAKHRPWYEAVVLACIMPINLLLTLGYSLLPRHARQTV